MLKASSLYIVIIIALVIALLCSALVTTAYYYRLAYQKKFRHDRLENNLNSGINLVLGTNDTAANINLPVRLFTGEEDSVRITRMPWGIYELCSSRAHIQQDTLNSVFLTANRIDSSRWAALYLIDEDRPLSLSGKTSITGDAFIPKAGVKTAYVDNKAYQGSPELISGHQRNSAIKLPPLNNRMLQQLEQAFRRPKESRPFAVNGDSVQQSFLDETKSVWLRLPDTVRNVSLRGNLTLYSDTTLVIDSTATLEHILVFARSIIVKSGFKGNCQLFATDSIIVSPRCNFTYPSAIGLLRLSSPTVGAPLKISMGEHVQFSGAVFTYEKNSSPLPTFILLGKNSWFSGQVYAQGVLSLSDGVSVSGSVFASKFLYQSQFTAYENYLINVKLNSRSLSPYYLSSGLFPVSQQRKKVLQWIKDN